MSATRASDRDREQTAERLRHAAGEGRLFPEELEERLRAAFAARTYGELDALVEDLPSPATPASPSRVTFAWVRPVLPWLIAFGVLLLLLMAMAVRVRHASFAAPPPSSVSASPNRSP